MLHSCPSCRRHVFLDDAACPFCATPLRRTMAPLMAVAAVTMIGCGSPVVEPGEAEEGGAAQSTSDGGASTTTSESADEHGHDVTDGGAAETTFASEASTGDGTDIETTSAGFIYGSPDGSEGDWPLNCDVWLQDCPEGEKCNAWANDGGSAWNSTRCVPVAPEPDEVGEACDVEGSGVSGLDSCDLGAMCWDVDPRTNIGECVALCQGDDDDPTCRAETTCVIANDGVLILCLESCDPVAPECDEGELCYPVEQGFICEDWPGESAAYGDPCRFPNQCDPGLACTPGDAVPDCGASGCCSDYCDLDSPLGDEQCIAAADGAQCVPFFVELPDGWEHVGVCQLP